MADVFGLHIFKILIGMIGIDAIAWSVSNAMAICLILYQIFIAFGAYKELKTETETGQEDSANQDEVEMKS